MKVPLGWLREYVNIDIPVAELADRLTLAGLEVSGVRLLGLPIPEGLRVRDEDRGPVWDRDKVIIARVLQVDRHPNADRLTLVTLDYGKAQKQVVTGAPNIKVGESGQKVIVALCGSVLFDGHAREGEKKLAELKPTKIRGVPSDSMVCSAFELGLSDEQEGIILLEEDAPVGTPLADYMGDIVLELEVTPNLARCLSMIGVAREVAALTGGRVRLPPHTIQALGEPIVGRVEVRIEDPRLCARYAAALLKNVKIGPAPAWMQRRLTNAGMRPINNVVDITNYVMLEWGQPLHAFDHDKLVERANGRTPTIIVRPARPREVLVTLDNNRRELTADNLVIADSAGPVALAGVMGGLETEVTVGTSNILLEAANFDFVSVRRTMRALNLPSEASQRFSKGLHPETVLPAAERAAELMRLHAAGSICKGLADAYPAPVPPQVIALRMGEVRRILGMDFPIAEAQRILTALEYTVTPEGSDTLRVIAPPHRRDIQEGPADLIEDLIRIHGYDRLPATLLADELPEQHGNLSLAMEEQTRDLLVRAGLQEVITYALTAAERETPLGLAKGDYVRLLNPISSERAVMRQTILAGMLEIAANNLRHTESIRVFEIGSVYLPRKGERLPEEPRRLGIVMSGRRWPDSWADGAKVPKDSCDFFDLKGVISALLEDLHIEEYAYRPASTSYLHPGMSAELLLGGASAGTFGQLHPRTAETLGLSGRNLLVAELELEEILKAVPGRHKYRPVPRFPAALRDVAVIVDESVTAERILAEIKAAGGSLLRDVKLFDVYRGESIAPGTKSLAYALSYQAEDRTLVDKEVDKAHKAIENRLKHVLKAQIRGEE
jgi:phenylalanyl-tRNA synthetase beta chain